MGTPSAPCRPSSPPRPLRRPAPMASPPGGASERLPYRAPRLVGSMPHTEAADREMPGFPCSASDRRAGRHSLTGSLGSVGGARRCGARLRSSRPQQAAARLARRMSFAMVWGAAEGRDGVLGAEGACAARRRLEAASADPHGISLGAIPRREAISGGRSCAAGRGCRDAAATRVGCRPARARPHPRRWRRPGRPPRPPKRTPRRRRPRPEQPWRLLVLSSRYFPPGPAGSRGRASRDATATSDATSVTSGASIPSSAPTHGNRRRQGGPAARHAPDRCHTVVEVMRSARLAATGSQLPPGGAARGRRPQPNRCDAGRSRLSAALRVGGRRDAGAADHASRADSMVERDRRQPEPRSGQSRRTERLAHVEVPASIPADCSGPVDARLNACRDSVPSGFTARFAAHGCYRQAGSLRLRARKNIVVDGEGAGSAFDAWRIQRGSDIRLGISPT